MRYKKMTNPTDGINQTNKQLETVEDQICCVNQSIKDLETAIDNISVTVGDVTFAPSPQLDSFGR